MFQIPIFLMRRLHSAKFGICHIFMLKYLTKFSIQFEIETCKLFEVQFNSWHASFILWNWMMKIVARNFWMTFSFPFSFRHISDFFYSLIKYWQENKKSDDRGFFTSTRQIWGDFWSSQSVHHSIIQHNWLLFTHDRILLSETIRNVNRCRN